MDFISAVVALISMMILFSFGFYLGYKEGMATMKRIDDNIIEEAKRCIYGDE
jgi:amino acid permease